MAAVNALLPLVLVAGAAIAATAATNSDGVIDKGTYRVYLGDRALGTEDFRFERFGDTLRVQSHAKQVLPGPGGDTLGIDKQAVLVVGRLDYDLKFYNSVIKARGKDLTRALVVEDTAFTAYRETSAGPGEGDRFHRPPGRFFVIDSQVFVLFDVMCRDLAARQFSSRQIGVVLLRDDGDQVTKIKVTDMGADTIRWAARPVTARRLTFGDSYSKFHTWVHPQGYMVRLEQEGSGLWLEREPSPAVKRRESGSPR